MADSVSRPNDGPAAVGPPAPAAGPPPSSLLEHSQNVVTRPTTYEVTSCGCDCWYCPDCCARKGYNLRAELIPILETFSGLMMLTLTIDPTLFKSARAAYLYVRKKRAISRLMRELDRVGHLHSRRYFYVVEFQHETEQAHFHVLVDATRIPKAAIDRAWSRFRPKKAGEPLPNRPAFGMTRFSVPRFEGGPEHAGRYATKYLVKSPEHGWPVWVMSMGAEKRVTRYQTSRGFWKRPKVESVPTGKTRDTNPLTYAQRVATCGDSANVFQKSEVVDHLTGEVRINRNWQARVALNAATLAEMLPEIRSGRVRMEIQANGVAGCIQALTQAAGEPVRVLSGQGASR